MKDLNEFTVLVTRPEDQAGHFIEMINSNNGSAINLPTIDIAASSLSDKQKNKLRDLSDTNIVIFVSVNAVNYALKALKSLKLSFPENLIVAAVGPSTAAALQENDVQVDIVPEKDFSSEGLLATPELDDIAGEEILIFKGQYGRELLSAELVDRYAHVDSIECYQRVIPKVDTKPIIKLLKDGAIDAVTVTSVSSITNLFEMFGDDGKLLTQVPFVVASRRIAEACEDFEINFTTQADNAGDKAMLEALSELANRVINTDEEEEEEV